ncbi:unnamed protein product [Chrysoparadoxa australica]
MPYAPHVSLRVRGRASTVTPFARQIKTRRRAKTRLFGRDQLKGLDITDIMGMETIDIKLELQMMGVEHRDALEKAELARRLASARLQQVQNPFPTPKVKGKKEGTRRPCSRSVDERYQSFVEEAACMEPEQLMRELKRGGVHFSKWSSRDALSAQFAAMKMSADADAPGTSATAEGTVKRRRGAPSSKVHGAREEPQPKSQKTTPERRHYSKNRTSSERKHDLAAMLGSEAAALTHQQLVKSLNRMEVAYNVLADRGDLEELYVKAKLQAGGMSPLPSPSGASSEKGSGGELLAMRAERRGRALSSEDLSEYDPVQFPNYGAALAWARKLTYQDVADELLYRRIDFDSNADFGYLTRLLADAIMEDEALGDSSDTSEANLNDYKSELEIAMGLSEGTIRRELIKLDATFDRDWSKAELAKLLAELRLQEEGGSWLPVKRKRKKNRRFVEPLDLESDEEGLEKLWGAAKVVGAELASVAAGAVGGLFDEGGMPGGTGGTKPTSYGDGGSGANSAVMAVLRSAANAAIKCAEAAAEWSGGSLIAKEHVLLFVSGFCLVFRRGLWSCLALLVTIRQARIALANAQARIPSLANRGRRSATGKVSDASKPDWAKNRPKATGTAGKRRAKSGQKTRASSSDAAPRKVKVVKRIVRRKKKPPADDDF